MDAQQALVYLQEQVVGLNEKIDEVDRRLQRTETWEQSEIRSNFQNSTLQFWDPVNNQWVWMCTHCGNEPPVDDDGNSSIAPPYLWYHTDYNITLSFDGTNWIWPPHVCGAAPPVDINTGQLIGGPPCTWYDTTNGQLMEWNYTTNSWDWPCTVCQPNQPPTAGPPYIWLDTNGGGTAYKYWNGSAWVSICNICVGPTGVQGPPGICPPCP